MSLEVFHLLLIDVQEVLNGIGQIVHALDLSFAISEDFTSTAVTSHDSITSLGVYHIVRGQSGIG